MAFWGWSKTAASNAAADPTINMAEGMAPSAVNDGIRAAMARLAEYRDDNGGFLQTAGTSTAYTLTTNQVFDTTAHMNGMEISFYIHATSGVAPTLNVDGLGAFPFVVDGAATPPPTGSLVQGTNYTAIFSSGSSQWRLRGFFVNPYNVPVGGGMLYFGVTVPNSNFAFPMGQGLSTTTYAALFALIGYTYGGVGATFNLPDLTGCVPAMKEASATRLTSSYFGGNSTVLGATGGLESNTLTTAQLAVTTPAGTISAVTPSGSVSAVTPAGTISAVTPSGTISAVTPSGTVSAVTPSGSLSGASSGTDTILVNGVGAQNLQGGTTGFGWSNSPTMKAISAALSWAGTFTGSPSTPTFTGSPTTPTFTGSPSTPTFTGSPTTPTFTGSPSTPTFTGSPFGSGAAHNNVQPTIICNYIIRII